MRQPAKQLTARFVQTVTEPGKYFAGHSLYLKVDKNGSKFWIQRIVINGKRTEMGLGSVDLVSLAEARAVAFENRKLVLAGGDPLAAKRKARALPTFEEAAHTVHQIHKPTWKNPKHADQFINTLTTYAFPRLAKIKVSDVTSGDVLAVLDPIWLEKSETARRVKQRIGTVMKWCMAQGWRKDNPVDAVDQGLPKRTKKVEHRKALPYTEVGGCIKKVQASKANRATKLCLELLILTALRSVEAREARWEEIDFYGKVWEIPAERMKMKRPHRIPLSDRALEILQEAACFQDEHIFPGSKRGKPLSDATLRKLVREHGFEVDIHGFRTSFRTWVQEQTNYPRDVAEAALAHVTGNETERAYARSDMLEKRRAVMQDWADYLAKQTQTSQSE